MSTQPPLHLGGDAWLVHLLPDGDALRLPVNSLVLRGDETVLVDTATTTWADRWWAQVEAVVTPDQVRWIFLSHDDADHAGNLAQAMLRCPSATVVTSAATADRLAGATPLPAARCRLVDDGDVLDLGDRRLEVVRPPAYDSGGTRGLFDHTSGVYWAADCFGAPLPHLVREASDVDADVWTEGFVAYHRTLSPWTRDIDPVRWRASLARVAALDPRVIASTHGAAIRRPLTTRALDLLYELAAQPYGRRSVAAADASR